ncbi:MAG: CapA family protein [Terracidiphilus sp.]|jgi:poly-gamma-glutamate synthesis protein (capsule biosynthesis protein)
MSGRTALLAAAVALLIVPFAAAQPAPGDFRLLFTGDVMMSRLVRLEIDNRKTNPWTGLSELFTSASLVGGNFEGTLGDPAKYPAENRLCFAAPDSAADLMKQAGFRLVTAENNHSGDLGQAGRSETRAAFQHSGLLALDFDSSPQFFRFGDLTVGFISVTTIKAADGRVEQVPSVELAQKLRLARQLANLVVVSIHWGNELQDWPTDAQQQQARWLVEHGADLIVGHHPHVVQAPACVEGKPVFFSLGNHLFDQKYAETKNGLIADCHIQNGRLLCGAIATHTDEATAYPKLAGRNAAADQALAACSPQLGPGAQINGVTIRPQPWSPNQPVNGIILDGYKIDGNDAEKLVWQSRRQTLVSLQLVTSMAAEPMLLSLERHNSSIDDEVGLRPYVYAVGPHGLIARWRGSALAWPLIDAVESKDGVLCALHRGDSFLLPDPATKTTRIAAYRWNGFGFTGIDTPPECEPILLESSVHSMTAVPLANPEPH